MKLGRAGLDKMTRESPSDWCKHQLQWESKGQPPNAQRYAQAKSWETTDAPNSLHRKGGGRPSFQSRQQDWDQPPSHSSESAEFSLFPKRAKWGTLQYHTQTGPQEQSCCCLQSCHPVKTVAPGKSPPALVPWGIEPNSSACSWSTFHTCLSVLLVGTLPILQVLQSPAQDLNILSGHCCQIAKHHLAWYVPG